MLSNGLDRERCEVLGYREAASLLEQPVGQSVGAAIWGKLSLDKGRAGAFLERVLGNSWALESLLIPQKF